MEDQRKILEYYIARLRLLAAEIEDDLRLSDYNAGYIMDALTIPINKIIERLADYDGDRQTNITQ